RVLSAAQSTECCSLSLHDALPIWKDLLVRDVHDMIVRDRHHPAIVIWGTRANESANDVELYRRTKQVAKSLDDNRRMVPVAHDQDRKSTRLNSSHSQNSYAVFCLK